MFLEQGQECDVTDLRTMYPSSILKEGYLEYYEKDFEWYFDPERCMPAGLQDYQRLMLRSSRAYLNFDYYQSTSGTYQNDREFVNFYDKLEKGNTGDGKLPRKWEPRVAKLVFGFFSSTEDSTRLPEIYFLAHLMSSIESSA